MYTTKKITSLANPSYCVLYHELGHGYSWCKTYNTSRDDTEFTAISVENELRDQRKLTRRKNYTDGLLQKHWNGTHNPRDGECYTQCIFAFITSASIWISFSHHKLQKLRTIRNEFLEGSTLGRHLFNEVLSEYYRFSPVVAHHMILSPNLRIMISHLIAEPFVDFFTLLEKYLVHGWKYENFRGQFEVFMRNSLQHLTSGGFTENDITQVYRELSNLKSGSKDSGIFKLPSNSVPSDCLSVIRYVFNTLELKVPRNKYLTSTLITPLILYWSLLARMVNHGEPEADNLNLFIEGIQAWIDTVPIPNSFSSLPDDIIRNDLNQLSKSVFAIPTTRYNFGRRILRIFHKRVPYNLESMLLQTDYLPQKGA